MKRKMTAVSRRDCSRRDLSFLQLERVLTRSRRNSAARRSRNRNLWPQKDRQADELGQANSQGWPGAAAIRLPQFVSNVDKPDIRHANRGAAWRDGRVCQWRHHCQWIAPCPAAI